MKNVFSTFYRFSDDLFNAALVGVISHFVGIKVTIIVRCFVAIHTACYVCKVFVTILFL